MHSLPSASQPFHRPLRKQNLIKNRSRYLDYRKATFVLCEGIIENKKEGRVDIERPSSFDRFNARTFNATVLNPRSYVNKSVLSVLCGPRIEL